MKSNKLSKIFLLLTSFQTILLGSLFIMQLLRIYFGNEKDFTREICGQYILEILPVIILWIILVIGSFIYFNITDFKYKNISKISYVTRSANLMRVCPEITDETIKYDLRKLNKKNLYASIILLIIVVLSAIMGLCYLLNIKHFDPTGDLFKRAVKMSIHLMPWVVISFGAFIGYVFYIELNAKKTTQILLDVIRINGKQQREEKQSNNRTTLIIQFCTLVIAITLIVIGIANGGAEDVLQKAINICTECIGLG